MFMVNNEIGTFNEIVKEMREKDVSKVDNQIGEIIFKITSERKKQKISQSELSAMTGIPQTTISRIETFISTPTLPVLLKIINALNMKFSL